MKLAKYNLEDEREKRLSAIRLLLALPQKEGPARTPPLLSFIGRREERLFRSVADDIPQELN